MSDALSELQRSMATALRERRSLAAQPQWSSFAGEHVSGNDRLSPVEQLEIYREQFWLRHTSSLLEDFPGLSGILGQDDWEKLAEQYLTEVAPDSYTLRDLGQKLPQTIERASWLPHQALCLDMARLELAYIEVFDAPDLPPLAPERLASLPEDKLGDAHLVIAPCVRLLSVRYPIANLRRELRAQSDESVAIPAESPQNLVVYRRELTLWDMPLSDVGFAFLTGLAAGRTLAQAAESAVSGPFGVGAPNDNETAAPNDNETAAPNDNATAASNDKATAELAAGIGGWLQEWTVKGFISDVRLE